MGVETAADRTTYFDPDVFGSEVTVAHVGGPAPYSIDAIFEDGYVPTETLYGAVVSARAIRATFSEDDLRAPLRKGDQLTVEGTPYTADSVQPDGTGLVDVVLSA